MICYYQGSGLVSLKDQIMQINIFVKKCVIILKLIIINYINARK